MSCMTLDAQDTAMAATQLIRVAPREECALWQTERRVSRPLRMKWIVVTEEAGGRRLCARWIPADDIDE